MTFKIYLLPDFDETRNIYFFKFQFDIRFRI